MRTNASSLIGVGLLLVGAAVMCGWLLDSRSLLMTAAGAQMVFNTALCFTLTGCALVAERWPTRLDLRLPFFHLSTQEFWEALDAEMHVTCGDAAAIQRYDELAAEEAGGAAGGGGDLCARERR